MKAALAETLAAAVEAVEAAGLRYAIAGGIAMNTWVRPRATRDVDLYVELRLARHPLLLEQLKLRGFDVPAMEEELQRFGVFRSKRRSVFLDIFEAVGPLGEAILAHRKLVRALERELWITAPEELLVLKAFSDREKDYLDLVELARRRWAEMDHASVEEWAHRLDTSTGTDEVSSRLARALAAARKAL